MSCFKPHQFAVVLTALTTVGAHISFAQLSLIEDFSTDPFATWVTGIGDNSNSQFVWDSAAPPVYTGDVTGSLYVHLDSSLPSVRLQRPLGGTLSDMDDFTLKTRFSFIISSAPTNQSMQIAFGLVNGSLTGGDRTGTITNFTSDDVFHTVEYNYFANISTFSLPPAGPTLTPTVFGAQKEGNDAFGNLASIFGPDSDLSDNSELIELPQNITLEVGLDYVGATKMLTLSMNQINPDGTITQLNTELPPMDLANPPIFSNYDTGFPYVVNTLAIMAYQDGFTTTNDPSLIADLKFERFEFSSPVPEPSTMNLVMLGLIASSMICRKVRSAAESRTDRAT